MRLLETLESRTLLTATLEGGVLTVVGNDRPNIINIDTTPNGKLVVGEVTFIPESASPVNRPPVASRTAFNAADVNSIVIRSGGGNDIVNVFAVKHAPVDPAPTTLTRPRPARPIIAIPTMIDAGAGNDRVHGNVGRDVILGGDGDDVLIGGAGADTIRGGIGNDHIDGGAGIDELFGGAGNDLFFAFDRENDKIDGGDNDDPTRRRPGDVAFVNEGDIVTGVERIITAPPRPTDAA